MTKKLLAFAAFLALCAGPAGAAGINLGWNDCPAGAGYSLTRTSLCNVNTGTNTMFVSFVAPPNVLAMSAAEVVIDLQTGTAGALQPWWSMRASAPLGCRTAAMTQSADFTAGPFSCFDYWAGGASAGVSMDAPTGNNRARIKALPALPAGSPGITSVAEGTEVYVIKVNVNNSKTVGLGSCAGCSDEACIVLNSIKINQPVGPPADGVSIFLSNPATSQHVIWQAWTSIDPNNQCPLVTPARRQTWGSIKAIYR